MNACKKLIRTIKGRGWAKSRIKLMEAIDNKTPLQQFRLCSMYETATHIPFLGAPNEIYELCLKCPLKVDSDIAFQLICDENGIPKYMGELTQHDTHATIQ